MYSYNVIDNNVIKYQVLKRLQVNVHTFKTKQYYMYNNISHVPQEYQKEYNIVFKYIRYTNLIKQFRFWTKKGS